MKGEKKITNGRLKGRQGDRNKRNNKEIDVRVERSMFASVGKQEIIRKKYLYLWVISTFFFLLCIVFYKQVKIRTICKFIFS